MYLYLQPVSAAVEFPYTVCDNGTPTACANATLYILCKPFNTDPDFNVTLVNVPVPGDVHTNDDVPTGTTYGTPFLTAQPGSSTPVITMGSDGKYIFTADKPGVYVYNVPVCAPGNACVNELLTITVTDPNTKNPPIANTDIATTKQGVAVTLNTLVNDAAGYPGAALVPSSVSFVTTPNASTEGSVSVNAATGEITFTPVASFTGVVTYTYKVCDNTTPTALCATAIQQITVNPITLPNTTEAADDYNTTPQGVTLTVPALTGVLSNDTDPQGNTQTVTTTEPITVSGKGTVTIAPNGSYVFVPVSGFSGTVDFPYTVCDNGSPVACANATLHILCTPANTDPDVNVTYINVPVPGDVHTNDEVPVGTTYGTPVIGPTPRQQQPVITMNPNGTYVFTGDVPGVYVYNVPVCAPGNACVNETLPSRSQTPIQKQSSGSEYGYSHHTPGVAVTLNTLANDAAGNPGGSLVPSSVSLITTPNPTTEGTLSINPSTGTITFTPVASLQVQ